MRQERDILPSWNITLQTYFRLNKYNVIKRHLRADTETLRVILCLFGIFARNTLGKRSIVIYQSAT